MLQVGLAEQCNRLVNLDDATIDWLGWVVQLLVRRGSTTAGSAGYCNSWLGWLVHRVG